MRFGNTGEKRLLALALAALSVGGCNPSHDQSPEERARETGYRGILLAEAIPKPDFTLPDTRGRPFRFREETDGLLTLLYFGYTHCPDVCPVQMANLAAVLKHLPYGTRHRTRVVFITTDPERDTARRLRQWLDHFDPDFVGLRGELSEVKAIQARLGLPPAEREPGPAGEYVVGHTSQVIAFGPDGPARVVYPFGSRQADWTHDLPKLARSVPSAGSSVR